MNIININIRSLSVDINTPEFACDNVGLLLYNAVLSILNPSAPFPIYPDDALIAPEIINSPDVLFHPKADAEPEAPK